MATVSVVVPDVTDAGLKDADAPDGTPEAANVTAPLKPPEGVTVNVYGALPPGWTVCEAGAADSEKSGAVTVMVRVALGLVSPPSSVTVNDAA